MSLASSCIAILLVWSIKIIYYYITLTLIILLTLIFLGSDSGACNQTRCPRVWCGPPLQHTPNGACCPICPPQPTASFVPAVSSFGCSDNGNQYAEGEKWNRDPCILCTCEAGLPLCSATQCAAPACAHPIQLPDQCCPICLTLSIEPSITFVSHNTECEYGGQTYKDGASWVPAGEACKRCSCEGGTALCMVTQCSAPECENPIYSPDTCCPVCPGTFLMK